MLETKLVLSIVLRPAIGAEKKIRFVQVTKIAPKRRAESPKLGVRTGYLPAFFSFFRARTQRYISSRIASTLFPTHEFPKYHLDGRALQKCSPF